MSASRSGRQSLFYRDLASPISAHRGGGGRFATPGQAAAVSALWRENFAAAAADPPPPPAFTLDDRADFSPDLDLPLSSSPPSSRSPSPLQGGIHQHHHHHHHHHHQQQQQSPGSSNWWSPLKGSGGEEEKGRVGSPVDGVVQARALMVLPPPREVARPEPPQHDRMPARGLDEEEWVTVYGFSAGDTNLVLREFEKCGVILKHVPGPKHSNWMHILYQNQYDAQKALRKNGMQLNPVLIVGVKLVDAVQRQSLNERLNSNSYGGFMVSLPPKSSTGMSSAASPTPPVSSARPLTSSNNGGARTKGAAIARPEKSAVSKIMDLMFGF